MQLSAFNAYCESLPHTTHVVQWGASHVWKIGGKLFAVGAPQDETEMLYVTFKVSELSYDILKEQPGCRPAPYLASRGMKWIQRTGNDTLSDTDLKAYLEESYRLVAAGLTKTRQRELGFLA